MRKFVVTLAVMAIAVMSLMSFGGTALAVSNNSAVPSHAQALTAAATPAFFHSRILRGAKFCGCGFGGGYGGFGGFGY